VIAESELEDRLRKIGQEHREIETELDHYIEDMGYKPSYAFDRLLDSIGTGRDYLFDPRSSEAKALRRLAIDIGLYRKGQADSAIGSKYNFKLDGKKYSHENRIEEVVK